MSPVLTPLDSTQKLGVENGDLFEDPSLYRQIVGKLNFLTNTRPDLAFTVQHLSQFMQQPWVPHFKALLHVLQYRKHNSDLGILLNNQADVSLTAYCDSDWAVCVHARRSVNGYVIFFGQSLISWKSKKQGTVTLSFVEAEYKSLRRLVAELAWLSHLLHELTIADITPIPIKCDNQAAIYIAKNFQRISFPPFFSRFQILLCAMHLHCWAFRTCFLQKKRGRGGGKMKDIYNFFIIISPHLSSITLQFGGE